MKNRVVIIFVEGDTEIEFYKKLVQYLKELKGCDFDCYIEYVNVKGIGGFKKDALRIFEKRIKIMYPISVYDVVLCYDTDVFDYGSKPPVNWSDVTREFKNKGVASVKRVQARQCIEDWYLLDVEGIRNYLRLPNNLNIKNYRGVQGIEKLFQKANKTYAKGTKCKNLVQALNMKTILPKICSDLKGLCEALGIDCKDSKLCISKSCFKVTN